MLLTRWKAKARASELDAQLMLAPRTFVISFFFARPLQMAPIGAIDSLDLMLCEKLRMEQGQRQSCTMVW